MTRTPLSARPRDMLYFGFFVMHIMATLCVDLQPFYPAHLVPEPLKRLLSFYMTTSNDPCMQGAMGLLGAKDNSYIWFKSLIALEGIYQLPTFIFGLWGLWNDDRRVLLPLLIYGASTTTTVIPVLSVVLWAPSVVEGVKNELALDTIQRTMLLSSYIPFLVLPILITVDMTTRIRKLIEAAPASVTTTKRKSA